MSAFSKLSRKLVKYTATEGKPSNKPSIAYWWFNARPDYWDLEKFPIGKLQKYSVYNHNGNKRRIFQNFANAKPGDLMFGYVTTPSKKIVAMCKITRAMYGRPGKEQIEFKKIKDFSEPVAWADLKAKPGLSNCEALEGNHQGSLFSVTPGEFKIIIKMLEAKRPKTSSDYEPTADEDELERRVSKLRKKKLTPPAGQKKPATKQTIGKAYFRDPQVKAWILENACGKCEGCGNPSPFIGEDGKPFLECHHVRPLANHGSDRLTNAVALCPNCHRRAHLGVDRKKFKTNLYANISRLIRE